MNFRRKCRMNGFSEAVIICKGNLGDPGFFLYLAKVKENLQDILKTEKETFTVKKVEKWNSVKVTFNLPQNAASRLRDLARQSPSALEALGIHSVQVDGDQVISVILADQSSISFSHRNILPVGQSSVNSSTPPDSGIESSASTSGASADNNGAIAGPSEAQHVPTATIEAVKRSVIDYLQSQNQQQDTSALPNEFRAPHNFATSPVGRLAGRQVSAGSPASNTSGNTPSPASRPQSLVQARQMAQVSLSQNHQLYLQQQNLLEQQQQNEFLAGRMMGQENPVAGMEHMVNSRNIVSNSPLLVNLLRSASPTGNSQGNGVSEGASTPVQQQFFPQHMVSTGVQGLSGYPPPHMASAGHSVAQESVQSEPTDSAAPTPPKKKRKQYKKKNQNNLETTQSGMQMNAHTVARPHQQQVPYQYPPGTHWYHQHGPPQGGYGPVPYSPNFHGQYRHPQQQALEMEQLGGWYHQGPPVSSSQQFGIHQHHYHLEEQNQTGPNPNVHSELLELSPNTLNKIQEDSQPLSKQTQNPQTPIVPACPEHISQSIDAVLNQVTNSASAVTETEFGSTEEDHQRKAVCDKKQEKKTRVSSENGPVHPDPSDKMLMEFEMRQIQPTSRLHMTNGPDCDMEYEKESSSRESGMVAREQNSGNYGMQGRTLSSGPGEGNSDSRRNSLLSTDSFAAVDLIVANSASSPIRNSLARHGVRNSSFKVTSPAFASANGVSNGLNGLADTVDGVSPSPVSSPGDDNLEEVLGGPQAAIAVRTVHGGPRSPSAILEMKQRQQTFIRTALPTPTTNGRHSPTSEPVGMAELRGKMKFTSDHPCLSVLNPGRTESRADIVPISSSSAGLTIDILAAVARSGAPDYFVRPSPSSRSASSSTLSEPSPVPSEGSRARSKRNSDLRSSVTSPVPSVGSIEEDFPSSRSRPRRKVAENSAELVRHSLGVSERSRRAQSRESSGGSSTASGRSSAAKRRGSSNSSSRGGSRERILDETTHTNCKRTGIEFEIPLKKLDPAGRNRLCKKKAVSPDREEAVGDSSKKKIGSSGVSAANHAIAKAQSGRISSRRKR